SRVPSRIASWPCVASCPKAAPTARSRQAATSDRGRLGKTPPMQSVLVIDLAFELVVELEHGPVIGEADARHRARALLRHDDATAVTPARVVPTERFADRARHGGRVFVVAQHTHRHLEVKPLRLVGGVRLAGHRRLFFSTRRARAYGLA